MSIQEKLTPGARAFFDRFERVLAQGLKTLPDKPAETATNTLRALWHTAAGRPISAERAASVMLPELDGEQSARLQAMLRDRINGTPLAYLTGRQQFMGMELIATADALIPRGETELLGAAALEKLRAIVREQGHASVIDVCTGSGNLALALAWHEPGARVLAADLSEVAIVLARRNLALLGLADRVEFRSGDLLAPFDTPEFHGGVDLLICNPPYISSGKVDGMPHEIIGYEPRLAFDGGPLGIRILLRLIAEAPRFLRDGGWLAFEIGLGQGPGIRKRIEQSGDYAEVKEVVDGNGQVRALIARRPLMGESLPDTDGKVDGKEYAVVVADVLEECQGILSLWRTGLDATHSYEAKFDWYYRQNPDGTPDALFLRYGSRTNAVGVAAVGHRRMRFNNATFLAGVLVDFVVRPEHRTLFPALFLQREVHRQGLQTHQLVWGLPNPRATAVFGRAGYHCVGQFARYVRVLRSAKYLERHFPRWMSRAAGPLIDWARMGSMAIRGFGARGYVMKWQDQPDARFDDLWERSAKPGQLMGVRNEQYLTWRFVDCPFGTYTFLTLVSPGDRLLLGYAVCELEQQTMHVCDFLVDENAKGAAAHLWRELAREAFGAGCASLSTEFLGSERVQQELKDAGLIAREHFPLYAGVADRSPPLLEEGHWYITCADADG